MCDRVERRINSKHGHLITSYSLENMIRITYMIVRNLGRRSLKCQSCDILLS
jgi:hypothetical protein